MVNIREIPITGKMREDFEKFFKVNGEPEQFELSEVTTAKLLKAMPIKGIRPNCSVCGHGLIIVPVFENKKSDKKFAVGQVCASNLRAIGKLKGDIDELNFKKMVKLERKTITKRMLEFEAEQNKISLEIIHNMEVTWLYELVNAMNEGIDGDFWTTYHHGGGSFGDRIRQDFKYDVIFFKSINSQIMRSGKLSDKQMVVLQKAMKRESDIDKRIQDINTKFDRICEEAKRRAYHDWFYGSILTMLKKYGLDNKDKTFLESLKQFYREKGYYTDKQITAIKFIWGRYYDTELEYPLG